MFRTCFEKCKAQILRKQSVDENRKVKYLQTDRKQQMNVEKI